MTKKRITGHVKIDLIKKYMKENKLSQKRFAEICRINIWNLRKVLSDDCHFDIVYLFKIARAMGIQVNELIK